MANNIIKSYNSISVQRNKRYRANDKRLQQIQKNRYYFEKAQNQYASILKILAQKTHKGRFSDDLIDDFISNPSLLTTELINSGVNKDEALKLEQQFNQAYQMFFYIFAYCIEDAESLGEYINDTELNYGITLLKDKLAEMHVLNREQTSTFIRNQSIFGIHSNGDKGFTFGMRNNINTSIVEQGIIKATGEESGGKNLALQLFGEEGLELQQRTFAILEKMQIYTKQAVYYQGTWEKKGEYFGQSRMTMYEKYLADKVQRYNNGQGEKFFTKRNGQQVEIAFTQEYADSLLEKRRKAMNSTVTTSRKLEGSYRLIADDIIKIGMSDTEIEDTIKEKMKKGWIYSDNKPGVTIGDLEKKEVSVIQKLTKTAKPLEARDVSLKVVQDQKYNPSLYDSLTLFNTYDLMEQEAFSKQEQINLQKEIDSGQIVNYPEVRAALEEQIPPLLYAEASDFFNLNN